MEIAAEIVYRSQDVTRALLATVRIGLGEIPVAFLAHIASSSFHVSLAMTRASDILRLRVGQAVTNTLVESSNRIAIARSAHVRALNVFIWITVEEWHALFTVLSLCIVLAVIAYTTAYATRMIVDSVIEVTADGMIVAVALYNVIHQL